MPISEVERTGFTVNPIYWGNTYTIDNQPIQIIGYQGNKGIAQYQNGQKGLVGLPDNWTQYMGPEVTVMGSSPKTKLQQAQTVSDLLNQKAYDNMTGEERYNAKEKAAQTRREMAQIYSPEELNKWSQQSITNGVNSILKDPAKNMDRVMLGTLAAPIATAAAAEAWPIVQTAGQWALSNPYINAALTSIGGAHAYNSIKNGSANVMTALELMPMVGLGSKLWNTGIRNIKGIKDVSSSYSPWAIVPKNFKPSPYGELKEVDLTKPEGLQKQKEYAKTFVEEILIPRAQQLGIWNQEFVDKWNLMHPDIQLKSLGSGTWGFYNKNGIKLNDDNIPISTLLHELRHSFDANSSGSTNRNFFLRLLASNRIKGINNKAIELTPQQENIIRNAYLVKKPSLKHKLKSFLDRSSYYGDIEEMIATNTEAQAALYNQFVKEGGMRAAPETFYEWIDSMDEMELVRRIEAGVKNGYWQDYKYYNTFDLLPENAVEDYHLSSKFRSQYQDNVINWAQRLKKALKIPGLLPIIPAIKEVQNSTNNSQALGGILSKNSDSTILADNNNYIQDFKGKQYGLPTVRYDNGGHLFGNGGDGRTTLPHVGDSWRNTETGESGTVVGYAPDVPYMGEDGKLYPTTSPVVKYDSGETLFGVLPQYYLPEVEVSRDFKSQLDWSPESWFGLRVPKPDGTLFNEEEAERLSSHVPEYLNIEKKAKTNDTWLKMPDGSIWEGDPRSWVMMQSEAFKKNYDSQPWYTGQAEWPTKFDYPDDEKGIVRTNKMIRAPYYDDQMWFSNDKSYGDAFAHFYDSNAFENRRYKYWERDVRGKNFLSAIPKDTYRDLDFPLDGTADSWSSMPYKLEGNNIVRLPKDSIETYNKPGYGFINTRIDDVKVITDSVANWSKELGDKGILLHNVEDGPGVIIPSMEEFRKNGKYIQTRPILEEFISQPGFTKKVKFIEGNTGDFDITNPYKYAYNDKISDNNYAVYGGSLIQQANMFATGGPKKNIIPGNLPAYFSYDPDKNEYISDYYSDEEDAPDIKWYKSKQAKELKKTHRQVIGYDGESIKYVPIDVYNAGSWKAKGLPNPLYNDLQGGGFYLNPFENEIITGDGKVAVKAEGEFDEFGNQLYETDDGELYTDGSDEFSLRGNLFGNGGKVRTYRIPKNRKLVRTIHMNNGTLTAEIGDDGKTYWFRNGKYISPERRKNYKFYDKSINGYRGLSDIRYDKKAKEVLSDGTPVYAPNLFGLINKAKEAAKKKEQIMNKQKFRGNGNNITLRTKGVTNLATVPMNLLDSIAVNSGRSNVPIKTGLGLVAKESTLGGTSIPLGTMKVQQPWYNPYGLVNNHAYFENPEDDYLGALIRKYDFTTSDAGIVEAEKDAQYAINHGLIKPRTPQYSNNILADAFARYVKNPNGYNSNQQNYASMVTNLGNEVWGEPQIQQWWNTSGKKQYERGRKEGM